MKHIVIGGDGFTGRHLVKDLRADGLDVLVCDMQGNRKAEAVGADFLRMDISDPADVAKLPVSADDLVYHLAARQYHLPVPKTGRTEFFEAVNFHGVKNVLQHLLANDCRQMIYFSTDMVYGIPSSVPVDTDHARNPLGEYGASKKRAEDLVFTYREKGMNITIFRPRLIIGPGRLGVLTKLFSAITKNLPVPLIGNGSNSYQMISVFDCVSAVRCAVNADIPNDQFNLGSDNPPSVYELLQQLINANGSRSLLIKTPAKLVKLVLAIFDRIGLTVLYREQYAIADINYLVNIEKTKAALSWTPQYNDTQMINAAFDEYIALHKNGRGTDASCL